jgi:hypothetical protein
MPALVTSPDGPVFACKQASSGPDSFRNHVGVKRARRFGVRRAMESFIEFMTKAAKVLGGVAQISAAIAALIEAVVAALGGRPFGFAA